MKLIVSTDGDVTGIYTEDITFSTLGRPQIQRASDVEPNDEYGWTADLRRSGGPVFGPFDNRSQAIEAEICWLEQHLEKVTIRMGRVPSSSA